MVLAVDRAVNADLARVGDGIPGLDRILGDLPHPGHQNGDPPGPDPGAVRGPGRLGRWVRQRRTCGVRAD